MNLNLYGHAGQWLMVDFGITFGDETTPGVDVITPDPSFIAERKGDLAGLVLTHAHEDHLGAVPYYGRRSNVRFMQRLLRRVSYNENWRRLVLATALKSM